MVQVPAGTAGAASLTSGVAGSSATASLPTARVLPEQSWLTTEKSPLVVAPPSSLVAEIAGFAVVRTSGASPTLVTVIAVALLAAGVPAGTEVNCGVRVKATGAGSPARAAKLLSAEVNGLKPPLAPGVTGSYS